MQYSESTDDYYKSYEGTPQDIAELIKLQMELETKKDGRCTVTIKPSKEFSENLSDFSDRLKEAMRCNI